MGAPRAGRPLGVLLAALLLAVWLITAPRTPDLAAQVYRVDLFGKVGLAVWDEHWYGGHHLPGYSLLFPPLGWLLGIRVLGALSVLASTALFERIVRARFDASARWGAVFFAAAAVGDVWVGRLAYALGVCVALAAVLSLMRGRTFTAAALSALCAVASPVAGALLGLAGLSGAIARRSSRDLLTLAAPAALMVAALTLLFPEGGFEPYPLMSFLATALVVIGFLLALPHDQHLLRAGAVVYLAACLFCLLVHTPIGSNVERYGVLLAGPLLLCTRPRALAGGGALAATAIWVVWGPVRETAAIRGDVTSASYYAPVKRFLAARGGAPVRVEVPLTRSHWEAALLAPSVSLARGWEKQLDERYNAVLLGSHLSAAGYQRWLRRQAVSYVALPDAPLDPSSAAEGRLVARGLPYLRERLRSRHWRIYEVLDQVPLASGPGRLTALGSDSFTLQAAAPGTFVVRVRFTRYWTLVSGAGCVRPAPGGWTSVQVRETGPVRVAARFSLSRALSPAGSCAGRAS